MASSRIKSSAPTKRKWLRYLVLLLCGGGSGVGGWQFKDHPVLQRIVYRITGHSPKDGPLTREEAFRAVAGVLKTVDAYHKAGEFEVTISQLKLDRGYFKVGQTLDIQARLIKRHPGARDRVVWDSQTLGENLVKVGGSELRTNWDDQKIVVRWEPGDGYVFEVWDRYPIFDKKWFEWASASDRAFPLRSGSYILSLAERGTSAANPKVSQIVLEAHPRLEKTDSSDPVATKGDDTIRIK